MGSLEGVSIVIPSYEGRRHLERCLAILETEARDAEVIVVDGGSKDGSAAFVEERHPWVRLFRFPNHGWAHATNRGIEVSRGAYVLCLNSDAFVSRAAIVAMRERLAERAEVGAVAPMLDNEDGSRQALFGLWYWPTWRRIERPTAVPLLSGACFMTTREHLARVGLFDERFFLYNDEFDWCVRTTSAGYLLELLPISVTHVGGGSTSRSPLLRLESQRGFAYLANKHSPEWVANLLRLSMQFEGWSYKRLDPRPEHRVVWAKLESIMKRRAYLESPFPLSGRGVPELPRAVAD